MMDALLPLLRDALAKPSSPRVAVLTGAGISAESGIPTFREAQTGLWERYDPMELATPQGFQDNPELVWNWYEWRKTLVRQAAPNPGHYALVELEQAVQCSRVSIPEVSAPDVSTHSGQFTIITQNIDNMHRLAGSERVIELHGNIFRTRCAEAGHLVEAWEADGHIPPRCPLCRSLLRPDVVWFNESLPIEALRAAVAIVQSVDILLVVGTSALVHPAASLPLLALDHGALLIEVNPSETPLSKYCTFAFRESASVALPEIVRQLKAIMVHSP